MTSHDVSYDVKEIIESREKQKPAYPHHRLQFNPEIANFGILEEDRSYRMKIELKNTGMFTGIFLVPVMKCKICFNFRESVLVSENCTTNLFFLEFYKKKIMIF